MDLKNYYDFGYHGRRHARLIADGALFTARASVEKWLYFRDLPTSSRVFDFGCGIGQSIALLPQACGWDLSRESREISRGRGITVFEELGDVPSDSFDLVFSRHTLEHVPDPPRYLEDARRFARASGQLRLVLPARERTVVTTQVDTVNLHLYCWTPQTIVNLLHISGWQAERVAFTPYGGYTKMLPVYRALGPVAYRVACQAAARVFRTVELTVTARKR
jgi:SAM-dependent methyltransferase